MNSTCINNSRKLQQQQLQHLLSSVLKKHNNVVESWPLINFMKSYIFNNNNTEEDGIITYKTCTDHNEINIVKFIKHITTRIPKAHIEICHALYYVNNVIEKLNENKQNNEHVCHHCLLSGSFILASKFIDDRYFILSDWAKVCNMKTENMIQIEKSMVNVLEFNLFISWSKFKSFSKCYDCDPF
eukprot:Pgem_evm1s10969